MRWEKLFLILCILIVVVLGMWAITVIIEPEVQVVYVNHLNIDPSLESTGNARYVEPLSLAEKAMISNNRYTPVELRLEEEYRILESETRNWNGRIDGVEYQGRDERIFGSERFHIYAEFDSYSAPKNKVNNREVEITMHNYE